MKILLINTVPTEQNGITGVIFNYLKAIDAKDITFDLLSLNTPLSQYSDIVEAKGGRVFVLPRLNGVWAYWKSLRRLIKKNHYDAVHIHGNSHTVVLELSAAWAADCVVRMVHSHTTTCKHVVVLLGHPLCCVAFVRPVLSCLFCFPAPPPPPHNVLARCGVEVADAAFQYALHSWFGLW